MKNAGSSKMQGWIENVELEKGGDKMQAGKYRIGKVGTKIQGGKCMTGKYSTKNQGVKNAGPA